MKKIIAFAFTLVFLVACGAVEEKKSQVDSPDNTEVIKLSDVKNVGFQMLEDGEKKEDKSAVVVKEMECSTEKRPVCGKIGAILNGYLNKCEAERHGAEVISEGFCELEVLKDEEKCEAEFLTVGNCEDHFKGFIFDQDAQACEEISGSGCNAQIPFETKEACEQSCSSK